MKGKTERNKGRFRLTGLQDDIIELFAVNVLCSSIKGKNDPKADSEIIRAAFSISNVRATTSFLTVHPTSAQNHGGLNPAQQRSWGRYLSHLTMAAGSQAQWAWRAGQGTKENDSQALRSHALLGFRLAWDFSSSLFLFFRRGISTIFLSHICIWEAHILFGFISW